MSDLISRQAAIDAIWIHVTNILENSDYPLFFQDVYKMAHRHIAELIQYLPSAEPVKHGRWIVNNETEEWEIVYCDQCHEGMWNRKGDPYPNYCFNCGAKMDEVEE